MRLEIPYCGRCCGFIPLRYGIIILGYLNLAITALVINFLTRKYLYYGSDSDKFAFLHRGVVIQTQLWVPILMYMMEIIFIIVLLIGAHKKLPRLMRVYYYYGIVTALAAVLIALVIRFQPPQVYDWYYLGLYDAMVFASLVLQVYMLLLIRSELSKVRYPEGQLNFDNHTSEANVHPHGWNERNPL